jgi:hypothetical protein
MEEFMPEYTFTEQDEVIRSFGTIGDLIDLVFPDAEAALMMTALKRIVAHGRRAEWQWSKLDGVPTDAAMSARRTWVGLMRARLGMLVWATLSIAGYQII